MARTRLSCPERAPPSLTNSFQMPGRTVEGEGNGYTRAEGALARPSVAFERFGLSRIRYAGSADYKRVSGFC